MECVDLEFDLCYQALGQEKNGLALDWDRKRMGLLT